MQILTQLTKLVALIESEWKSDLPSAPAWFTPEGERVFEKSKQLLALVAAGDIGSVLDHRSIFEYLGSAWLDCHSNAYKQTEIVSALLNAELTGNREVRFERLRRTSLRTVGISRPKNWMGLQGCGPQMARSFSKLKIKMVSDMAPTSLGGTMELQRNKGPTRRASVSEPTGGSLRTASCGKSMTMDRHANDEKSSRALSTPKRNRGSSRTTRFPPAIYIRECSR